MRSLFRDYTDEDKNLLLELSKKLSEYVKPLDPLNRVKNLPGYSEASLEETLKKVEKYQGKIWFVEEERAVIGYVIGVIWEQSEINRLEIGIHKVGEVLDIFVEANYRGKGIGKLMLQKMQDYFKENECDSMWIEVFSPNNNAHEMYKHFGFNDREIGMLKEI